MKRFQGCGGAQWFLATFVFACIAVPAFGQSRAGVCPSSLKIDAGESRVIDCGLEAYFLEYEWTSPDASWLEYLSDVTVASPHFSAPADISTFQHLTYIRLSLDQDRNVVDRELLSITVNPVASTVGCNHGNRQDCPSPENTKQHLLDDRYAPDFFDLSTESSAPFLDCEPRITVESGTMAEIRCTGLSPSGEQLVYRAEFDWAPYSETRILADGVFDYLVHVPLIDEPAAVRILEISASVPGKDMQVSQSVEIHIVNRHPILICDDLIVEEAMETVFPCSVTSDRDIEYQFISDPPLVQRGIYDHWPTFMAPEVDRDRSIPVIVRGFEAGSAQVVEADFMVRIRDTSGPMDFTIECNPMMEEVYEGTPDIMIVCTEMSDTDVRLVWQLGADGDNNPFDRINFEQFAEGRIIFVVPEDVDQDETYEYRVVAKNSLADDEQARAGFSITVLDTPQITISCNDAFARTGVPPLPLRCGAQNSKELPLDYVWQWEPMTRLSDPSIGTPLFDVPTNDEQQELIAEYEYEVTVSVDNPDIPNFASASANVTVTVEKFFGKLGLGCVSPIEVYEGGPSVPIDCSVQGFDPAVTDPISWTWTPLELLSLEEGGLIFQTPVSVPSDPTIYRYDIQIDAPYHDPSDAEQVEVRVRKRPVLSLGCQDLTLTTGMPPQRIQCEVSHNQDDAELDYVWQWDPTTRLSDSSISTPLFDVPTNDEQQELIAEYEYEVTVSVDNPDIPNFASASANVTVTVEKFFGKLGLGCVSPIEVYEGGPSVPIDCSVQGFDPAVTDPISWTWTPLELLSLEEGGLIFQTPVSVPSDPTIYRYDIQIDAPYHDPSDAEQVEVRVRKRPVLSLECQDLTVTVGMPPQRIQCEVSHDQDDAELDYVWQWDPTTLLSDISTGTPLFATPSRQRRYSQVYTYRIAVQTEHAHPVETMVSVTVISPAAGPPEEIAVSTSELDLGVVGPQGQVWLDPGTEQVSGLVYGGGRTHAGRMVIRAQNEVTLSMEQLPFAVLRHVGLPGELDVSRELMLTPQWAYSESCVEFAANTQASQTVQTSLRAGDCHVIRIGGTVELEGAEPGDYSGEVAVVVTIDEIDQLYSIPVVLTVEAERQVVVLGPEGIRIQPVSATTEALQWDESISIQPQVAVLGPNTPSGIFTITNPSVHSMEIEVSTEFGYRETRGADPFSVPATAELGDLAELVSVHPNVVVLLPGEAKQVRYAVAENEFARMGDRGYAAFFNFTVTSRVYIEQRRAPVAEQSARVTFQAPGVYIPGQGPEQLRATVESRTGQAAVILIETDTFPFYGDVVVKDDAGNELGRSEVLVHTRSRVRVDWSADPSGGLMLQFVPSYLDHIRPNDVYIPAND